MRISDWSSDVCSSDLLFVSSAAITPFSVRAQEATPESLWPEKTYQEDEFMPTITFYNPPKEKAVDVAIVVCPGGGYSGLASDHEGTQIDRKSVVSGKSVSVRVDLGGRHIIKKKKTKKKK